MSETIVSEIVAEMLNRAVDFDQRADQAEAAGQHDDAREWAEWAEDLRVEATEILQGQQ